MYYYELHENDTDLLTDLLMAHEELFEPDEFLDLVRAARDRLANSFEEDTLVEAVAAALAREHGFEVLSDDRLTASVRVGYDADETALSALEDAPAGDDWEAEEPTGGSRRTDDDADDGSDDPDELPLDADFVTITAELDLGGRPSSN